jgi:hypothetical protein
MISNLELEENNRTSPIFLSSNADGTKSLLVGDRNTELGLYAPEDGGFILAQRGQNTLPSRNGSKAMAHIFARPFTRLLHRANGMLRLTRGEVFIDAHNAVELETDSVGIKLASGALASIMVFQGNTYVKACSPLGSVSVMVNGKSFSLNPGEELLVSNSMPDQLEICPADGIGRRLSHSVSAGDRYVTISDFAIISMLSNSNCLATVVHSNDNSNRSLLGRVLKTAATVDTVLKYRGAYSARARQQSAP